MAKKPLESIAPTLPPHRAIELLQRQLARADEIAGFRHDDPRISAWINTTRNTLDQAFGRPQGNPHSNTSEFESIGSMYIGDTHDARAQNYHADDMNSRKAMLQAFIEQLTDLSPPSSAIAGYRHSFHPDVERVAGNLYRDGHFKQAALEAFILVINSVKRKSGLELDGDKLMNAALSFKDETTRPLIQFNSFSDESERNEQHGLYFIYKGLVGIRNSKAHSNTLFNDRDRAYEYLSMASLLVRLLDRASVNN